MEILIEKSTVIYFKKILLRMGVCLLLMALASGETSYSKINTIVM